MTKELDVENGDVVDAEDNADDHRLANARPAQQPGPTDEDGDGIVWATDDEADEGEDAE